MSDNQVHEVIQARYAAIASGQMASCSGSNSDCCGDSGSNSQLYESSLLEGLPGDVINLSLGCGDPISITPLKRGETVLDRGCGGIDCSSEHPLLSKALDINGDGLIDIRNELVPFFQSSTESDVTNDPDRNVPLTGDTLAHLQVPVLLLEGEHDGLVSPANSEAIAQELGGQATLKLYPGLGHGLSKTAIPAEDVPLMMEQQPIDDMAAWILGTK